MITLVDHISGLPRQTSPSQCLDSSRILAFRTRIVDLICTHGPERDAAFSPQRTESLQLDDDCRFVSAAVEQFGFDLHAEARLGRGLDPIN